MSSLSIGSPPTSFMPHSEGASSSSSSSSSISFSGSNTTNCTTATSALGSYIIGTHANLGMEFTFENVSQDDKTRIRARVTLIENNSTTTNHKVKLPEILPCYAQGYSSKVERLTRILRNCHLYPTLNVNRVEFQTTPPETKTWERVSEIHEFPMIFGQEIDLVSICHSNDTFSYAVRNTIIAWDWLNNKSQCTAYPTSNAITSIVELPNGNLLVGDEGGMLHFSPNSASVKVGDGSIEEIHFLSREKIAVLLLTPANTYDLVIVDKPHGSEASSTTELSYSSNEILKRADQVLFLEERTFIARFDNSLIKWQYDKSSNTFDAQAIEFATEIKDNSVEVKKLSDSQILIFYKSNDRTITIIHNLENSSNIKIKLPHQYIGSVVLSGPSTLSFGSKAIINYNFNTKKRVEHPNYYCWPIRSNILKLSDDSIMYATNTSDSKIIIIRNDNRINSPKNSRDLACNNVVYQLKELPCGSVLVVCSSQVFVIGSEIVKRKNAKRQRSKNTTKDIQETILDLKHDPSSIEKYFRLAEFYEQSDLIDLEYNAILAGLEASLKYKEPYLARQFYQRARKMNPVDKRHDQIVRIYQNRLQQNTIRIFNSIYRLPHLGPFTTEGATDPIPSTISSSTSSIASRARYKQRLLIGEGSFSFTAALIETHERRHPGLAKVITATELSMGVSDLSSQTTQRIRSLMGKGVKIMFGIDGTKIHRLFEGRRFERIHWVGPFGGSDSTEREQFRSVIPQFFLSASPLQLMGDRIHIVLADSDHYRQTENPIVLGSYLANYRLIRKRKFDEDRYPNYTHTKTGGGRSGLPRENFREFIFEKAEGGISEDLMNISEKYYEIKTSQSARGLSAEDRLSESYFECSTDEDTSGYEIHDPYGEEDLYMD